MTRRKLHHASGHDPSLVVSPAVATPGGALRDARLRAPPSAYPSYTTPRDVTESFANSVGLVDTSALGQEVFSMGMSHKPYPPEVRRQMVEIVRAKHSPHDLACEFAAHRGLGLAQ